MQAHWSHEISAALLGVLILLPATPVPLTWASVPEDYDVQLKALRRHLDISQAGFARLVGAAGKAVVYQWEARKRTPSPLF